jgi:hypothetical protein
MFAPRGQTQASPRPVAVLRRTLTPDVHLNRSLWSHLDTAISPPYGSYLPLGPANTTRGQETYGAALLIAALVLADTSDLSCSLRTPIEVNLVLRRRRADSPGLTASRPGPRTGERHGLTTLIFRGSIARHSPSLSTRRSRPHRAATQDSLPARGPALPGRGGYLLGSIERFLGHIMLPVPPSRVKQGAIAEFARAWETKQILLLRD